MKIKQFIEAAPDLRFRIWNKNNAHYAAKIQDVNYENQTMTLDWLKSELRVHVIRG